MFSSRFIGGCFLAVAIGGMASADYPQYPAISQPQSSSWEAMPAPPGMVAPLPPTDAPSAYSPAWHAPAVPVPSSAPNEAPLWDGQASALGQGTSPMQAAPDPAYAAAAAAPPAAQDEYYTLDELKAEMKKLVWKKGDFTIIPYAWLWANMVYETERSNAGDYTLFVLSAQDQGEPAFHVDAKSTRVGFDVAGPRLPFFNCAATGGKVEIDFQGNFTTENKGSVLLRHAYWEAKDETFRVLAGQTWDVISPLYPTTVMYSINWGAGNIGYRRAQFRAERYFDFSDTLLWTVQGSLNGNIIADVPSSLGSGTVTGDHSPWPVLMGRTALTFGERGKGGLPITLGLSGHIGEVVYDFLAPPARDDVYLRTWSMNVDLRAPITERFGFQGEYFIGENLGAYLGGILQGVDIGNRRGIYSRGGWVQLWYDITPRLHSNVGYSLDDPLDRDLSAASGRRYNSVIWGNLIYDITKQFTMGVEVGSWRTLYVGKEPGESIRVEFMTKYTF